MAMRALAGLGHERRHRRPGQLGQVGERPHREHASERARAARVDPRHASMRVGAPHEGQVGQPVQPEVVHVPAEAGDEAAVLLALD
jgi:hypothetical protein